MPQNINYRFNTGQLFIKCLDDKLQFSLENESEVLELVKRATFHEGMHFHFYAPNILLCPSIGDYCCLRFVIIFYLIPELSFPKFMKIPVGASYDSPSFSFRILLLIQCLRMRKSRKKKIKCLIRLLDCSL